MTENCYDTFFPPCHPLLAFQILPVWRSVAWNELILGANTNRQISNLAVSCFLTVHFRDLDLQAVSSNFVY